MRTNKELNFKGFIIPKGTEIEILEKDLEENCIKVFFNVKENNENEECIQILHVNEFIDIIY